MTKSSKPRAPSGTPDHKPRLSIPLEQKYFDEDLKAMVAHFGMNKTDVGRLALKELWKRRYQVPQENVSHFEEVGLSDIIPDFMYYDYNSIFERSNDITLYCRDLPFFLKIKDRGIAFRKRMADGKNTTVVLPVESPLRDVFSTPDLTPGNRGLARDIVNLASYHGSGNVRVTAYDLSGFPNFLLIADDIVIISASAPLPGGHDVGWGFAFVWRILTAQDDRSYGYFIKDYFHSILSLMPSFA